ncbi:DNA gyrase inhibitor YacG [Methylocapsa palsarum]|uniref:DNA gyrase inhibitor YacG n=1 Tax=Methylocapsa palsarum TaxID=1612308 RepID=A0A1I3WNV5_9HYPH|nr:DNA gyrase inhibitor YacG [Methylocapsa palsarum]SFK09208.1 hypothetical protein SAMN05444581_10225 [Methylocapsa palsarum]
MAGEGDQDHAHDGEASVPPRPCPVCGKPAVFAARPFCSNRCADVDLHRWLRGAYALPAADDDEPPLEADAKDRGE